MHPAGIAILVIILLLIAAGVGWIVLSRIRAQRLGLPPPPLSSYIPFLASSSSSSYGPTPAPGGIKGWFNDKLRQIKQARNTRTAAGAYEGSSSYNAGYSGGGGQGFRSLDDSAWDARVGDYNPYEEERELGLRLPPPGAATGGEGYQMNVPRDPEEQEERRGRSTQREPQPQLKPNPFGDDAEPSNISLRGVSPRPMAVDTSFAARKQQQGQQGRQQEDNSPTERRSIFRENM
ncbi:uncharacterized protein PODANS_1_22680 [Podospora anserina S mat+]|uniref:Podospora anserina S mat+ genomic DNA chromosome 1, supercontig 6 n=1 Tax=Podospora anserina (strain S / ATCC MYA-4624 / DSM 980 / FGSC 10383) TaxID=515849 RepID=B2AS86_PODAN|nr:uncharacterized protein PODANS_1_22680 [Podospora anserina S mat+]CAP67259.1 unnamed protein product [Podospora anserina S mat+]CDP24670.1 Putative protein of unknown function [Podospora anserina S mat+]